MVPLQPAIAEHKDAALCLAPPNEAARLVIWEQRASLLLEVLHPRHDYTRRLLEQPIHAHQPDDAVAQAISELLIQLQLHVGPHREFGHRAPHH